MVKEKTCILCETVHVSKQEMDEHMRSMLHHRELEKLKGRDCGHECRVCKVKVESLTDYASHISSSTHKEKVEAAEKTNSRSNREENYFDQTLVDLIEKRKEHIRKEKEAAAAKLAKEKEEQRRREEFQQRLQQAKEQFCIGRVWQPAYGSPRQQHWRQETRPWHDNKQGKSATWHAQQTHNFNSRGPEEFSFREQSTGTWGHGGNRQNHLPWLSNGGSSHGLYGHNNISRSQPRNRPQSLVGFPSPPSLSCRPGNQCGGATDGRGQQETGFHPREAPRPDHGKNSKPFGSNSKLDKSCRWSPYPISSAPHGDAHANPPDKLRNAAEAQEQEKTPRCEQRDAQVVPVKANEEPAGHQTDATPSASQKENKTQQQGDQKSSSVSGGVGAKAPPPRAPLKPQRRRSGSEDRREKSSGQSAEKPADGNQFLQSLQVSTSVSEPAGREEEKTKKKAKKQTCAAVPNEAGQSAESSEAQNVSSKIDLPPVLKRDINKHMSSKSKAGSHEPNLHIARRVRNLSGSRRSDTEKDSGLKPTVRQLLSSSGSRRNVNWDQVYQEVRKQQDKGRGLPRFGIEMVPCEQEIQSQEDEDLAILEGFQWEALMDGSVQGISRKRSLSESSVAPVSFLCSSRSTEEKKPNPVEQSSAGTDHDPLTETKREELVVLLGDSSSGAEHCDWQGSGKRRRAGAASKKTSSLEHDSKRMKVKPKKERLQIDRLLSVSLREDELSKSLQSVDANLIQARAALEAALAEVQRLLVVKQQLTDEMGNLRNKRIELLKGMQGDVEQVPQVQLKEEKMDSSESPAVPRPSVTDSVAPSGPVVVKTEPPSPIHVSSEPDAMETAAHCAHSTTAALTMADASTSPDPSHNRWSSPERKVKPFLTKHEQIEEKLQITEKSDQASANCVDPNKISSASSRRSSEIGSVGADFQSPSVPDAPASPSAGGGGKRVRKLKKRKALKKAQGAEMPETSDTEMEDGVLRPRWARPRRRPSGGFQAIAAADRQSANAEEEESPRNAASNAQIQTEVKAAAAAPSLFCNEVSSTSDMDLCKSSESNLPSFISIHKTSSDACSDRGEDRTPAEGSFDGHQEAVNAMQIHGGLLYTCSGDRTVRAFDLTTRRCVGVFEGHASKVLCLLVSAAPFLHHRLYSGSSDQTIRCYNLKTREFEKQFCLSDRVVCLHSRWKTLYAGLTNGSVVTFNLKTNQQMDVFKCHGPRGVSCLASLQEGTQKLLLVGSYDNTISVREAKSGVLLRTLQGHNKSVLCMKVVNDVVFSGSSDHSICAHNVLTGDLVHVFKNHCHAVTVVTVLGKMMITACLDKLVRVYDMQTPEQIQIYGGHTDMVLCMTTHKNMIYTGCYDGSVQAVKLNLNQNFHCQWQGCGLVFGMRPHLQQHLVHEHAGGNAQRCRWKNCDEFLCGFGSSKQTLLLHMQKHTEETEVDP